MSELHWSDTPEWKAYKSKQAELEQKLNGGQGGNVRGVGTITTMPVRPRSRTTHDLQMEACQVEWVDPNPPTPDPDPIPEEEIQALAKEAEEVRTVPPTELTVEQAAAEKAEQEAAHAERLERVLAQLKSIRERQTEVESTAPAPVIDFGGALTSVPNDDPQEDSESASDNTAGAEYVAGLDLSQMHSV